MKISDLCKMIEESIHSGRYPLDTEAQKKFAPSLHVANLSGSEDLKANNIKVETRVGEFFVTNNYLPNIQHLPGVVELDVLDSFKMICRRIERLDQGIKLDRH
ncbi:MAG TPA: hypothetical protein VIB07_05630 [Nitrososphaera sp.]|jgi:hypothetical protein